MRGERWNGPLPLAHGEHDTNQLVEKCIDLGFGIPAKLWAESHVANISPREWFAGGEERQNLIGELVNLCRVVPVSEEVAPTETAATGSTDAIEDVLSRFTRLGVPRILTDRGNSLVSFTIRKRIFEPLDRRINLRRDISALFQRERDCAKVGTRQGLLGPLEGLAGALEEAVDSLRVVPEGLGISQRKSHVSILP